MEEVASREWGFRSAKVDGMLVAKSSDFFNRILWAVDGNSKMRKKKADLN